MLGHALEYQNVAPETAINIDGLKPALPETRILRPVRQDIAFRRTR